MSDRGKFGIRRIVTAALSFLKLEASGNTGMIFAIALPLLLGSAGMAIDLATFTFKRNALQAAADEAATAGAKDMSLSNSSDATITAAAKQFLAKNLLADDASTVSTVNIDNAKASVSVKLQEDWSPFFAHFVQSGITPIIVNATATLQGENKVCVLALNETDNQAYRMMNNAHVEAPTCSVNSNSVSASSMDLQNFSSITAAQICSAGGFKGSKSQTSVPPLTDCPKIADPLAGRSAPAFGGCTDFNTVIKSGSSVLTPGVYCGGIKVTGTAKVTFSPGVYIIQDGALEFSGSSAIDGSDVGFYLTGKGAILSFTGDASIQLSGAETGDMAGILFFGDRTATPGLTHNISSSQAHALTGTVYFPVGDLRIDPNASVAEASAFTAIIVDHLRIEMGPQLVLNTNYSRTSVPVPAGISSAATVVLTQ